MQPHQPFRLVPHPRLKANGSAADGLYALLGRRAGGKHRKLSPDDIRQAHKLPEAMLFPVAAPELNTIKFT